MLAPTTSATDIIKRRYELTGLIGTGGMGAVYRALDRLTGKVVAIKRINSSIHELLLETDPDSSNLQLALAQEFAILASLRHPNIISVLDYGFDEALQPFFTMDILENAQTLVEYGANRSQETKVNLLIQLLRALSYLHRRGIIHRDLKPGNVLVDVDEVKVLDFGLSLKRNTVEVHQEGEEIIGTLAYVAPENLAANVSTNEQSDIYAVGVIGYQLFTGLHPFTGNTISELIDSILYKQPDCSMLDNSLALILTRLMAKSPIERYSDLAEIIKDLSALIGQSVPVETQATRESFIQAADFVGRDAELSQLVEVLTAALNGQGSLWLVGGESGIGKSRLLEELRIRALVRGALVLRGQGITESGGIYQIWREVIRLLALNSELTDFEAGVLKQIAPDIGTLIGRTVPDVLEVEPRAMKDRLVSVIVDVFRRQMHPMVVILEDLQWENEGIEVLTRLSQIMDSHALLIVGSYRDDEMAHIPQLLPNAHVLKLNRLSEDSIAALSESMIGSSGRTPQIVDLLSKETEGNVYFLVEVMRALAEETGQLASIGSMTLPQHIFAGGIRDVLQRRLRRMPADAFPILQPAAIYGRQLDLNILKALFPTLDLEAWLVTAADANVLEVYDDNWRFAHDKLREEVLRGLEPEQARQLHGDIARAIESVYPGSPQHLGSLAYHWALAQVPEKEFHYSVQSGEAARRSGLDTEAVKYLSRALELDKQLHAGPLSAEDKTRRGTLLVTLGSVQYWMGAFAESITLNRQALDLLGEPFPSSTPKIAFLLLAQLILQGLHRLSAKVFARPTRSKAVLSAIEIAYTSLSQSFFFQNEVPASLFSVVRRLNVAEMIGPTPQFAKSLGAFSFILGVIPLHSLAKGYARRALEMIERVNSPVDLPETVVYFATYYAGTPEYKKAESLFVRAIETADKYRNLSLATTTRGIYGWLLLHCESNYARSHEIYRHVYETAKQYGYIQQQLWGINGQIHQHRSTSDVAELDKFAGLIDEGMQILATHHEPQQLVALQSAQAMIHLRKGKPQKALEAVRTVETEIAKLPPVVFSMLEVYSETIEILLTMLIQNQVSDTERPAVERSITALSKGMKRYARTFPIGRPSALIWQGIFEHLKGKSTAQATLKRALQEAEKLGIPLQIGQAHYYLGVYGPEQERRNHLTAAQDVFNRIGAAYDAQSAALALH